MDMTMQWYSPMKAPFVPEGFPFIEKEGVYRRLSLNPPVPLPPSVEGLSWCTAGGMVRFAGTFKKMTIAVKLRAPHAMDHMTATGEAGFDLYLSPDEKAPRYYNTSRFDRSQRDYESVMVDWPEARHMECVLHFPLYEGVQELLIGFDREAVLEAPRARKVPGKVVVYGTSITQGGCANRPGMAYTNILARNLDMEVVNEGFSGSGRCEDEAILALRDIPDMRLFVLDTEANCGPLSYYIHRYPNVLFRLRQKYPALPILVVTKAPYARELLDASLLQDRLTKKELQRALVQRLRDEGDENIFFLDGEALYDEHFEEYTVDGVHATDLGFLKMAQGLEPVIRNILHLA